MGSKEFVKENFHHLIALLSFFIFRAILHVPFKTTDELTIDFISIFAVIVLENVFLFYL